MGKINRPKSGENSMSETIEKRQIKERGVLLEQLRKTPIVQIACEKSGIGRATYYRWRQEDKKFAEMADEALLEGSLLVNDMAESQLFQAIRNQNLGAIVFWLKNHHPAYTNKVEITGRLMHDYQLTPEQEALITKALKMVSKKSEKEKQ